MDSGNPTLDRLFNNLSSVYSKDNGQLNSNMYVIMNAYAEVFDDSKRKISQVSDDTYIISAEVDALEANFGTIINFPKPPRLNTTADGDNIYRFMLSSLFKNFLSGATISTMETILNNSLSLLTTDPNTADYLSVVNFSQLRYYDTSIELANQAVHVSGNAIIGPAEITDIFIDPPDIGVSAYDNATKTISFTGTVQSGVTYKFLYQRDNTSYNDTNWMNLTNQNVFDVSPMNLRNGPVSTFNNPEFSYWWNTFNQDGDGVVVNEFEITASDSAIVWRLPEKTVSFISPYTSQIIERSFDFYNLSGTSFDLSKVSEYNPDVQFSDLPQSYLTEVSARPSNYYVRYGANNNGPFDALSQFSGTFTKYVKRLDSINFTSPNFGPLDFFEKGENFSEEDLFGSGTKHIWLNVENVGGKYSINNTNFHEREFSLHQDLLYKEGFDNGIGRITGNFALYSGASVNIRTTEPPASPLETKENCILLASKSSGSTTSIYPTISESTSLGTNFIQADFFDPINSGTSTFVDVIRTGTSGEFQQFRFGIDKDIYDFIKVPEPINPLTNPLISGVVAIYSGNLAALTPNEYDKIYTNTKDYGFLETYYNSQEQKEYVLRENGSSFVTPPNFTGSYIDNSGSPYGVYSTGTYVNNANGVGVNSVSMIPNVIENSLLKNADTFEIDFDVALAKAGAGTSGTTFQAGFRIAIPAGSVTIRNGAYYGDGIYIPKTFDITQSALPLKPLIVGTSVDNLVSIPAADQDAFFNARGLANVTSPTIVMNDLWLLREFGIGGNRWTDHFLTSSSGQELIGMTLTTPSVIPIKTVSNSAGNSYSFTSPYTESLWSDGRHKIKISRNDGSIEIDGVVQSLPPSWQAIEKNVAGAWRSGVLFYDPTNASPSLVGPDGGGTLSSQNDVGLGNDKSVFAFYNIFPDSTDQYIKMYKMSLGNSIQQQDYLDSVTQSLNDYVNAQVIYNNLHPLEPAYASYISEVDTTAPYYYQITNSPGSIESVAKNYINGFPREKNWHRLTFDFGTSFKEMNASVDEYLYYSTQDIGFSGNVPAVSGFTMSIVSDYPTSEFAYFDNVEMSYFDKDQLLPKYSGSVSSEFWEGSYLSQSTVIDNKFFSLEPVPNYQFNVEIKGLDEGYIFIVNDIIDRVKPAHTLAIPIYLLEQKLDTTSQIPSVSNSATNWETGNIDSNIIIGTATDPSDFTDLPGLIGVSGLSTTGTSA